MIINDERKNENHRDIDRNSRRGSRRNVRLVDRSWRVTRTVLFAHLPNQFKFILKVADQHVTFACKRWSYSYRIFTKQYNAYHKYSETFHKSLTITHHIWHTACTARPNLLPRVIVSPVTRCGFLLSSREDLPHPSTTSKPSSSASARFCARKSRTWLRIEKCKDQECVALVNQVNALLW